MFVRKILLSALSLSLALSMCSACEESEETDYTAETSMPPETETTAKPEETAAMSEFFPYAIPEPEDINTSHLGLHVEEDGTITLYGKPYYGFGVNYFGAFAHYWYQDIGDTAFSDAFKKLKEYGVDYLRLPFCGYWSDYYDAFDSDPEGIFAYLDRVVEEAEKNRLGIIVSLMWHDTAIPLHVGGHRSSMGDPDSELVRYALDYTASVVSRYADSKAVWAWEIGNEYNLSADLCDAVNWSWLEIGENEPSGYDYYTSEELRTFYSLISAKIREYDGWRMITTGNGEMRGSSKAMMQASRRMNKSEHTWEVSWDLNSRADFIEMNGYMTPDPIDCVCFHLQQGSGDGSGVYMETMSPFSGEGMITQREYFAAYKQAADSLGKACVFGEMGDFLDMNGAPDTEEHFRALCEDIRASGIQLALTWQFQDFTDDGVDGMKLSVIGEMNEALKAEGLSDISGAWS